MEEPKPRLVNINGIQRTILGNKIHDRWYQQSSGVPEAIELIKGVKTKIQTEAWRPEKGANLLAVEVYLVGYRDMNDVEAAEVAEFDKSQTVEFQEYMRLKDIYDT